MDRIEDAHGCADCVPMAVEVSLVGRLQNATSDSAPRDDKSVIAMAQSEEDKLAIRGEKKLPAIPPIVGCSDPARRNDPCPCGSGMKYKRCHRNLHR